MKLTHTNISILLVLFIIQSMSCQAKLSKKMASILKEAEKPKVAKPRETIEDISIDNSGPGFHSGLFRYNNDAYKYII